MAGEYFIPLILLSLYAMFFRKEIILRAFGLIAFFALAIQFSQVMGGPSDASDASMFINHLRDTRSAVRTAISDDGHPPRLDIYENAAFFEKYGGYFDMPIRSEVVPFIIILADLKTGNLFAGFIPSKTGAGSEFREGVRRKLIQKAEDSGLLKNTLGEFYDGGDVIMRLVGNFPALKEGAPSGDLPLEQ